MLIGLSFLKPEEVEDCFTDDVVSILPKVNKKVDKCTNYILYTYVVPDRDFSTSL